MVKPGVGGLSKVAARLLGHDTRSDFAYVAGLFALYGVLDRVTRYAADVDVVRLDGPVLFAGALASNPLWMAALVIVFGFTAWRWPHRLFAPWATLEHGQVLRVLAIPLIALLVWQGSLYEFNFLLGQTHAFDRILLVGLAAGCLLRPAFLLPFALQSRIIADQFDYPFGTIAAQNVDELLIIALLGIAAVHALFVLSNRRDTAPVLLLLGAALATHFYIPGRAKLSLGWLGTTDVSDLPLSAYTAGWQGQGDGRWAEQMSSIAGAIELPAMIGTLVLIEFGAVLAVMHHRLLRLWLPGCIVFHAVVFAFTGFWFFSWVVFEVSLIVILTRPALQAWAGHNATPARALLAGAAVLLFGGTLFHPPGLAWLDSPVSYGYRIEATGQGGTLYHVPASAFAPLDQDIAFFRVRLGPTEPLSGPYGALISRSTYHDLQMVTSFADVADRDRPSDPGQRSAAQDFMLSFMDHANTRGAAGWSALSPPDHFRTGSPGPEFDFDEPLDRLDVFVLTAIHSDGQQEFRRELVLTLTLDSNGAAQVAFPEQ